MTFKVCDKCNGKGYVYRRYGRAPCPAGCRPPYARPRGSKPGGMFGEYRFPWDENATQKRNN